MADNLLPSEETLLLATRCFGRGTPFPHALMKKILDKIDNTPYEQIIAGLLKKKLISRESGLAFSLTYEGIHRRGFLAVPVPMPIWDAALAVTKDVVIDTIASKEWESVDLLVIHTAAIDNVFYSKMPRLYLELMSLSVFCLEHLGRSDDAELRKHQMQGVIDSLKSDEQ